MTELKKPSVKSKVEAVLFSTGHKIGLDEISKLCRARKEDVLASLQELQKEYDEKQSSLMLIEEGEQWKFSVRDHLISIVRKIVTETELTKSVLETLAVIAFKYPILQSDLIKLRTNKAYDHLVELEKSGYISRQKHGRTNLIKLTEKFFRYFDLTEEKLKDRFKDFSSIAQAIKDKEIEVEKIKEEQIKRAEDLKKEDEKIKKEIESLDKSGEEYEIQLETYEPKTAEGMAEAKQIHKDIIVENSKIGELEVVDAEQKTTKKEKVESEYNENTIIQDAEENTEARNLPEKIPPADKPENTVAKKTRKAKGIKLSPEMEAKVDEKVNEMLGISKKEESKEKNNEGKSDTILK